MEVQHPYNFLNIIARSHKMQAIFHTIEKIADFKTSILITGESGTGKELIAKAIHYNSKRHDLPMIDVNCGVIPETLLESELFGHTKGAFTDAYRVKKGLFEEAHGGTLFLDEMGELPLSLQVKLLRALQEDEIRPLGDSKTVKVDVRFYRINVLTIEVPPLRERREDIPLLVEHFMQKYNIRLGLNIKEIHPDCLHRLINYGWPGNVRELENVMERSMVLAEKDVLTTEILPPELLRQSSNSMRDDVFFWD